MVIYIYFYNQLLFHLKLKQTDYFLSKIFSSTIYINFYFNSPWLWKTHILQQTTFNDENNNVLIRKLGASKHKAQEDICFVVGSILSFFINHTFQLHV